MTRPGSPQAWRSTAVNMLEMRIASVLEIQIRAQVFLPRFLIHPGSDGHVFDGHSHRFEEGHLVSTLAALLLADDDVPQLGVDSLSREHAGLDGRHEVSGFLEHLF